MSAYGTIAGPARLTMPDGSPLLYNPGVYTEYDREQAHRTLTCPFCGTVETAAYHLRGNHWLLPPEEVGFDWPRSNGMCVGQQLVTNHISYYCKALKKRDANMVGKRGKFDEEQARKSLAEAVERGASIGIDGAKIMAFFTGTTCGPCAKGEHGDCFEDTTWSTMLDGPTTCDCEDGSHGH